MKTAPTLDLDRLILAHGNHSRREEGVCLLEAVAWFAGQPHSDHPPCVCPIIGAFGRRWNDDLGETERQRLKRFIPLMVGTKSTPEVEDRRAWLVVDWMVRTHTPAWLRLAGMEAQAVALESLPPITDPTTAQTHQPVLDEARRTSAAAWDAAWDAARDAASAAAWGAARDAASAAAWGAASAAAWGAARDAADAKLRPTVVSLQASAEDMLERLIAEGRSDG